jgi:hypothetical protein
LHVRFESRLSIQYALPSRGAFWRPRGEGRRGTASAAQPVLEAPDMLELIFEKMVESEVATLGDIAA